MKMAVVRELPNKFSKLERLVGKKADQSSLDDLVEVSRFLDFCVFV